MARLIIPKKPYSENLKESIFVKNAFQESIYDVLDDADQELRKAKKDNEWGDPVGVDDHISQAQGRIRKAEMMTESQEQNEDLEDLEEANSASRARDIKEVGVWTPNFPWPDGTREAHFYSSFAAAETLVKLGKTKTDDPASVARNIFAAAMACEGRTDRTDKNGNIRDRRWSAYIDGNEETILWDFEDIDELSLENRLVYEKEHPYVHSGREEEKDPEIKKYIDVLNNDIYYESCMKMVNWIGKPWEGFTVEIPKHSQPSIVKIPAPFLNKKYVKIFLLESGMQKALDAYKRKKEHFKDNEVALTTVKRGGKYIKALIELQRIGRLPRYYKGKLGARPAED